MKEVLGYAAAGTIWLGYLGLVHQWRKVWKAEVRPTIPYVMILVYLGISGAYSIWGAVIEDWFLVGAFFPGVILVAVLELQFHRSRPPLRWIVIRAAAMVIIAATCAGLLLTWKPTLTPYRHAFGLAASSFSILNLALVLPAQIRTLRAFGSGGSSAVYNGINLLSFLCWLAYGWVSLNEWLIVTQTIGAVLQSFVFLLHFRH